MSADTYCCRADGRRTILTTIVAAAVVVSGCARREAAVPEAQRPRPDRRTESPSARRLQ